MGVQHELPCPDVISGVTVVQKALPGREGQEEKKGQENHVCDGRDQVLCIQFHFRYPMKSVGTNWNSRMCFCAEFTPYYNESGIIIFSRTLLEEPQTTGKSRQ